MESSRTAEWFGWTFTTEEQVGETEKFLHSLTGMVLRHQSLLQEGQCVVLQLAGSVIGGEKTLRGPPMFPPSLSARNPRRTIVTESFEDSNVRTKEEPRLASKTSLRITPVDRWRQAQTQSKLRQVSCSIPNASTLHHASVRSRGVEQKAMILSLTPASSTSFKTTAATFLPVESELDGTPRRNSASSSPVRRTAMRSSVSPERDGRSFPSQCRPTSQVSPVPQFHDLLGGFGPLPAIRA
ncbi:hypothetical protein GWK47_006584 [Chionoecetes opilio]|uniref:Uncharacterized protein n=1 Tax=Chionoecetes opilio TaxID=41210 RepID=A0A8J4Y4H7_CHIOP|nr:hypothetical protein GWK47_006584 [Chionoecetes opilio]